MKALVVDDEKLIVKGIKFSLEQENMEVDVAYDGEEAFNLAKNNNYSIILLDVMLPKIDGLEVCRMIREFSNVPIIMVTAKGEDMDKIMGLEYGADDYITKPFNFLELIARVKAQLRRYTKFTSFQQSNDELFIRGLYLNKKTKEVKLDDKPVRLTPIEFKILQLLMENPDVIFSIQEIYEKVWNEPFINSENTVAVHIRRIREKIEVDPKEPMYLKVVWGIGYKISK